MCFVYYCCYLFMSNFKSLFLLGFFSAVTKMKWTKIILVLFLGFATLVLIFIYQNVYLQKLPKPLRKFMAQMSQKIPFVGDKTIKENPNGNPKYNEILGFYNKLGRTKFKMENSDDAENWAKKYKNTKKPWKINLIQKLKSIQTKIGNTARKFANVNRQISSFGPEQKTTVTMATVGCGSSLGDAMVLIKSAVIFSQDANLHVILFTSKPQISTAGQKLTELKWTANEIGFDFSFELQLEWFPRTNHTKWRNMWKSCSTQRLFFPSRLPHIDALIYLDADTIVLSNFTKLWSQFSKKLTHQKIAAMAPNTESPARGYYHLISAKTPYFGYGGFNAGVMLANLTRMRKLKFEQRALYIYKKFREKILLADQDVLNIMFNKTPSRAAQLSCSFNFAPFHCRTQGLKGFCHDVKKEGVHVVHGNMNRFKNGKMPFLRNLHRKFKKFDLLRDSYDDFLVSLTNDFNSFFKGKKTPCLILSAEDLYKNARNYLHDAKGKHLHGYKFDQ